MQRTYFDSFSTRVVLAAFSNSFVRGMPHFERTLKYHDLVYITSGEWEIIQNGERFIVGKDDVIILSANQSHGGDKPCADGTKTMYIHASKASDDYFESPTESFHKDDTHIVLPTVIHCRDNPRVKSLFLELVSTFATQSAHRNAKLDVLFRTLLLSLYDSAANGKKAVNNDFVEKVLQVIHASPQHSYSVAELCAMFFVSPKTLVSRFRSQTGSSPHEYSLNFKLRSIETLLVEEPQLKLHELARNFGFYDEFHLSRTFKKMYGISPREYRKQRIGKGTGNH